MSVRSHTVVGYRPPVPECIIRMDRRPVMHRHLGWTARWRLAAVAPSAASRRGTPDVSVPRYRSSSAGHPGLMLKAGARLFTLESSHLNGVLLTAP